MRAALYNGQKSIEMTELPTPKAGENDIVVKNIYASICGTDVAVYEHGPGTGHRITVGSEFGHEMVSEVFQVGKNVKNIIIPPSNKNILFKSRKNKGLRGNNIFLHNFYIELTIE